MEARSAQFLRQAAECPADLSVWTKLYATSEAMLTAMRQGKMIATLVEICSNLLGCEQVAIVEIERATRRIHFIAVEGLSPERLEVLTQSARSLESRIEPGDAEVVPPQGEETANLRSLGISALIPLWADQRSRGAMVLFQLLPQRDGFDVEDREVLQLLSLYAGPCLRSQKSG
jgi:hypothetical protein